MSEAIPDYGDLGPGQPTGEDALAELSRLADEQARAELEVEQAQEALKAAQRRHRELAEHMIPDLMDALGMERFTTRSGITIDISEQLRCSVPKARATEAARWVEEHGGASLVRREFSILFGRDDEKWAQKFERDLRQRKRQLDVRRSDTVHSSTLKKFLRGCLESGVDVPLELFGAYHQRVAKVTVKK